MLRNKYVSLMVIPSFLLVIGIAIYPFFYAVYLSFTNARLTSPLYHFVGLHNYIEMVTNRDFWTIVKNSMIYAGGATLSELVVGFAIALLLAYEGLVGRSVYRTIILIPLMIPPVIGALMWKIMLEPTRGPINYLIGLFGGRSLEWLSSPKLAMPTVMLIDFYLFTPFAILILLAGLQSIPIDLYEAAKVDGAGPIRSFFAVTLPLMWPTLTLVFLIRFTLSLATFDIIFATTGGGPGIATTTLSIQSYLNYYRWSFTSTATTYGMIIWIISLIFTNVFIARTRRGWR